jgi:putative flippase GtrA
MVLFYYFIKVTPLIVASALSYAIGFVINYFLQSMFTFQRKPQDFPMFVRFLSMHAICMTFNALTVWSLVRYFQLDPMVSQAIVIVFTTALSYLLASRWVFVGRASLN